MQASTFAVAVVLSGCSLHHTSGPASPRAIVGPSLSVRDPRDGQTYPIIQLAGRLWFTRNLNFSVAPSWCYDDDPAQCAVLGRLYSLGAARQACPPDWSLPSQADWLALAAAVGGHYDFIEKRTIGDPVKSYTALLEGGSTGFAARLGGSRSLTTGRFMDRDGDGMYWSSSPCGTDESSFMVFNEHSHRLLRDCGTADFAGSVRCVRSAQPVVPNPAFAAAEGVSAAPAAR